MWTGISWKGKVLLQCLPMNLMGVHLKSTVNNNHRIALLTSTENMITFSVLAHLGYYYK